MRYNIKALHQHDNGDYFVRINNKDLPYVDEDIVLAIKERNKEIERLHSIIKALHKYFEEHEQYEDNEFLRQLESCIENDKEWLEKMGDIK